MFNSNNIPATPVSRTEIPTAFVVKVPKQQTGELLSNQVDSSKKTNIINFKMKPNQLRVTVTDAQGNEISIITELSAIQNIANTQGTKAVESTVVKIFNDVVERMRTPPRQ